MNGLVKRLRYCSEEPNGCGMCDLSDNCVLRIRLLQQAANAIEELQTTLCNWCAVCPRDKRDLSTCEIYESCRAKPPKGGMSMGELKNCENCKHRKIRKSRGYPFA